MPVYPSDKAAVEHVSVVDLNDTTPNPRRFALARIRGEVQLVEGSAASALAVVDVDIFRHEFISIFRYSHSTSLHPSDIHIIEPIAPEHVLYEEENGTAFLAKNVMERLRSATERHRPMPPRRPSNFRRPKYLQ
ncbi:hypothetical protein GLOTRDRAFT_45115 [Gloeophyllum trabeum ATCC 11539]|uniref:Uncharacterized protein n=1 Tax=Gloeophyllum trabeum (strain ATCC 11539 / FP-39264 / Madison 617) TaxID=670483 RepID=S7Q168_GLOTA|nr:uncharacterized protein GLOTRDRAFT_45115 [Gloeophyllum trabeum ATCC 11539]EPQ53691.1 hypothetical protein GLOTRDRAFT_45115 [Gloeophyllum trabeum ATCC 11539]